MHHPLDWISELCFPLRQKFDERERGYIQRCLQQDFNLTYDQPHDEQIQILKNAVSQLLNGVPLAYVTGIAYFYGLTLNVDRSVLIPRPETEELVYLIQQHYKNSIQKPSSFLDIGTGSGCIAIALAKLLPQAKAYALDISTLALEVARKNASLNDCNIDLLNADILQRDSWNNLPNEISLIVSNPPYIPKSELRLMDKHVVEHEPAIALFTEDNDGLEFYEAIAAFGLIHGTRDAQLFFELNEYGSAKTKKILEDYGYKVIIYKDMQGKDRMLQAFRSN